MLTCHPERPTRINVHKYFYVLGLLSGIGLTFFGLSVAATIKSDDLEANLFMGIAGLLLAIIGLLPLMVLYAIWRRLPIERRDGWGRLTLLRIPLSTLSLSISCEGLALFSQKVFLLLLGTASLVPIIICGLFMGSGAIFL